jgi:hypothetical protein
LSREWACSWPDLSINVVGPAAVGINSPFVETATVTNNTQSGDQLNVTWTPAAATAPYISPSILTATPMGGSTAPTLSATVSGTAASGIVTDVVAATTYAVTVAHLVCLRHARTRRHPDRDRPRHNLAGWGPWSTPVYFSDGGN